jgi:DnaJ-class molecular chaperone
MLYEILGVDKKADINEIKKAYKKQCIKGDYKHPDKGGYPEKVYFSLKKKKKNK